MSGFFGGALPPPAPENFFASFAVTPIFVTLISVTHQVLPGYTYPISGHSGLYKQEISMKMRKTLYALAALAVMVIAGCEDKCMSTFTIDRYGIASANRRTV